MSTLTIPESCHMSKSTQLGPGVWIVKRDNGRYYMRFRNPEMTPQEKWPALDTKSEKTAMARGAKKYREFLLDVYDPWDDLAYDISIDEALSRYMKVKTGKSSMAHLADISRIIGRLKNDSGVIFLSDIAHHHIDTFIFGRDIKNKTRDSYRRRFSAFFNWCVQSGFLKKSPVAKVDKPKVGVLMPKHYTVEEFDRLLIGAGQLMEKNARHTHVRYANPDWCQHALELMMFTGLRISEAKRLTWGNVRFPKNGEHGSIHVSQEVEETKTREDRVIPIIPRLLTLLEHLQATTRNTSDRKEWVLKNAHGNKSINANHTNRRYNAFRRQAGLPSITLHGFRHSYAFYLIQMGFGIEHIKPVLGHSTFDITEIYTKMSPKERIDIMMKKFE